MFQTIVIPFLCFNSIILIAYIYFYPVFFWKTRHLPISSWNYVSDLSSFPTTLENRERNEPGPGNEKKVFLPQLERDDDNNMLIEQRRYSHFFRRKI